MRITDAPATLALHGSPEPSASCTLGRHVQKSDTDALKCSTHELTGKWQGMQGRSCCRRQLRRANGGLRGMMAPRPIKSQVGVVFRLPRHAVPVSEQQLEARIAEVIIAAGVNRISAEQSRRLNPSPRRRISLIPGVLRSELSGTRLWLAIQAVSFLMRCEETNHE